MPIRPEDIPDAREMDAVREAAAAAQPRRRGGRSRVVRWGLRLALGGALLVVLLVALLPTLASTNAGTDRLLAAINQRIGGRVEADDLRLAWLKGQRIEGLRLYGPDGQAVGAVDQLRLEDVGLIGLLRGTRDLGHVALEGGELHLVEYGDGQTNLDRALRAAPAPASAPPDPSPPDSTPPDLAPPGSAPHPSTASPAEAPTARASVTPPAESWPRFPADLRLALAVRDVEISVEGPSLPDVRVAVPQATATVDGPTSLGLTLEADVAQGQDRGQTQVAAAVKNLFDADGRLDLAGAEFDVEALVEHVPLAAVDRLAQSGVRWQTIIGPHLDAVVSLQGPTSALDALVTVTSDKLNVRQGLVASPQRLVAADASHSTLRVTPASWDQLAGADARPVGRLAEPFVLNFGLTYLDAPRTGKGIDLTATGLTASVVLDEANPVRLVTPTSAGVVVRELAAVVGSAALASELSLTLDAVTLAEGRPGELAGVVAVRPGEAGWGRPEVEAVLRSLPMPLIDVLTRQGERLTSTFGPNVGVGLRARADGEGGYALTADFDPRDGSPGVSRLGGTMTGRYSADGALSLKSDQRLRLTLTPEAFDQWMKPVAAAADLGESVGLSLPEAADLEADLDLEFALAGGPGLRFDPERTRAVAVIDLPETRLHDAWYHRGFPLRNAAVRIDAPDLREPVTARIGFETQAADGRDGRLGADVRVTGLMLDDGYVQVERGRLAAEVELDRVPTVVFDALSRQQGYAVAAFGETVSADIDLEDWSLNGGGRVAFELSSANNSLASFSGVDQDGYFVPDAPITLFLNQTPELSNKILRFLNPVLLPAVVSASVPMAVTIDDDTLRIPTRGFDLSKVDADVRVQMGTVSVVPTVSPVSKILPQLQALELIESASVYEARVSPVVLSIRGGVFGYDDLSFKIDDVELHFGGTISLVDQKVDMRMTLGGREIDRDPLLQRLVAEGIKVGGTVKQPEADFASVFAAFGRESLPQTLGGLLEGVLRKELDLETRADRPARGSTDPLTGDEAASNPTDRSDTPTVEEALGGLLGDFLGRELRRAEEKSRDEEN